MHKAAELYTSTGSIDKRAQWENFSPLVRQEALRLQVRLPASVQLDDLIQAGAIGLLDALDKFDASLGTAFSTYAVQRIRGSMLDELRSRDWAPRSVRRNARDIAKAINALEQTLLRSPTESEVAEYLGIEIQEYWQMLQDTNNSQIIDYEEWQDENEEDGEPVASHIEHEQSSHNPLKSLMGDELKTHVMEAIEALPEKEKLVLQLYYQEDLNLKEIGVVLNVGESRVCQLHSQAVKRIRAKLETY
ncbi:RNA polymerase sigma factor FliA [Thorsellia anophelis]|uniref:RNA polymerase sigma factor FliA n=1 Tax=Thorsellia anophelis DSM 18579 TaxID=1123402 RepID=A0A1I0B2D7_9GAMM|nr:RNA polymerase sigma factor FliA [Thorsellia anophelis]SET00903.1 RNA polymerase sigma factor for flagellar operon FliA [Thorsellia anophelis DSM 18579]